MRKWYRVLAVVALMGFILELVIHREPTHWAIVQLILTVAFELFADHA